MKKGILYFLTGILCFAASAGCFFFFVFHASAKVAYGADAATDLHQAAHLMHFGLAAALLLGGLLLVPYGIRKITKFKLDAKKKSA